MAVTSTHQLYSMGHSLWEVMLRFASHFFINDDNCVEDKESFEVVLSSYDPYIDIHIHLVSVKILDNDC